MGDKKVDTYVDAVRGLRALEQALEEEGPTPARSTALAQARIDVALAHRKLHGREVWLAGRLLAGFNNKHED